MARVYAVEAPGNADPEYVSGLRTAIETAVDHSIAAVAETGDQLCPVPTPILAQARLAANRRIPLETVLRRYMAGHSVVGDFVVQEAELQATPAGVLRTVLRAQASTTDRAVGSISAAYMQEVSSKRPLSHERRLADRVRRMLAGELMDTGDFDYPFDRWHTAISIHGPGAREVLDALAAGVDSRRLVVTADEDLLWVWLAAKEALDGELLLRTARAAATPGIRVGIGEAGVERGGWRRSHDQARAALSIARRGPQPTVRYGDVSLLAAVMHDESAAASLRERYLVPLEGDRDAGRTLRATIRTYCSSDQNVTSTAAALGVSRNTVSNRIRIAEERLGVTLASRIPDLVVALQMSELSHQDDHGG